MKASPDRYPEQLLTTIKDFFVKEQSITKKRLEQITQADPYHNPDHANSNADVLEDANEDVLHQQATAQKDMLQKKLDDITSALERVEKGTYGFCKTCGALIDTDRLSSNPYAQLCISCAQ